MSMASCIFLSIKKQFAADLKKSLPRIFFVDEPKVFWQFVEAGRSLADIHLRYEAQAAPDAVCVEGDCGRLCEAFSVNNCQV